MLSAAARARQDRQAKALGGSGQPTEADNSAIVESITTPEDFGDYDWSYAIADMGQMEVHYNAALRKVSDARSMVVAENAYPEGLIRLLDGAADKILEGDSYLQRVKSEVRAKTDELLALLDVVRSQVPLQTEAAKSFVRNFRWEVSYLEEVLDGLIHFEKLRRQSIEGYKSTIAEIAQHGYNYLSQADRLRSQEYVSRMEAIKADSERIKAQVEAAGKSFLARIGDFFAGVFDGSISPVKLITATATVGVSVILLGLGLKFGLPLAAATLRRK